MFREAIRFLDIFLSCNLICPAMGDGVKRHTETYPSCKGDKRIPIILSMLLILVSSWGEKADSQRGCPDCLRTAILENFSNPHAPQYEKQLEEWNKCMRQQLGEYASFDPHDPKLKEAMAKCAHLFPPEIDYMHPSSVISKLVEVLTSPCFHIALAGPGSQPTETLRLDPESYKRLVNRPYLPRIPEYFFLGKFEAGLSGEKDERGRDIKSRLTLELYYNGNPIELVKRWTTTSTLTSVSSQYNRMFDNPDAELRREKPIDNLLRDFERRPVNCQIDLGDKQEIAPGEEVEIKLYDFRDEKGRPSKHFNRIIVEVEHGRIEGGFDLISSAESANRRAFSLDDLPIKLVYVLPPEKNISIDKIIVYSSCQILDDDKVPMEMTEPDRKIAEKQIKIVRPDLTADYTARLEFLMFPEGWEGRFEINTMIRATYRLSSRVESSGRISEVYELTSSSLLSCSGQGSLYYKEVSGNCVTTWQGKSSLSGAKIKEPESLLIIDYDAKSGSVQKVKLSNFAFKADIDGDITFTQVCTNPPRTYTASTPFKVLVNPGDEPFTAVYDWPGFQQASGHLKSGIISGGGSEILGPWRLTLSYTLHKKTKE